MLLISSVKACRKRFWIFFIVYPWPLVLYVPFTLNFSKVFASYRSTALVSRLTGDQTWNIGFMFSSDFYAGMTAHGCSTGEREFPPDQPRDNFLMRKFICCTIHLNNWCWVGCRNCPHSCCAIVEERTCWHVAKNCKPHESRPTYRRAADTRRKWKVSRL